MNRLRSLMGVALLFSSGAYAQLIDFQDGDPSLIRTEQGPGSCIANLYIETQGFAFFHPENCASLFQYNGTNLALFFAQSFSTGTRIHMNALDNSQFDLLEFDQLVGASNRMRVLGYRGGEEVYRTDVVVSSGFIQRQQLNWLNVDRVTFLQFGLNPIAGGIDNILVAPSSGPVVPTLSIDNSPAAKEGDYLKFRLKLSQATTEDVTFDVNTIDGTATGPDDYQVKRGQRVIAAGQTERIIWVPAYDDEEVELNEDMQLMLSNPTNATLTAGADIATGTIVDTDNETAMAALTVADAVATEGSYARFSLQLSKPTDEDVRITVTTVGDTANELEDFEAKRGLRIIPAGQTQKTIWVAIYDDGVPEAEEQFELHVNVLSNNAELGGDGVGVGTISAGGN